MSKLDYLLEAVRRFFSMLIFSHQTPGNRGTHQCTYEDGGRTSLVTTYFTFTEISRKARTAQRLLLTRAVGVSLDGTATDVGVVKKIQNTPQTLPSVT